jgi:diguanylate cyclase (GGDEF)-like protein
MTFAVYLVLYVYGIIYQLLPHTTIYDMATFTQWFPLVYTAAFMFLSTRRAQIFCIVMYLLLLIPTILKTVFGHSAFIESDVYALLFNMNVAHPVFIAVLAGIAQFKESLVRATRHADQMRIAAHIDHLTGIPNRRAADQAMRQALNQNRQLSLILFDIDHFKVVNDTYGHDVGDEALIQIAQIVQHALLANEIFGRWGGEEFLIVLPGVALTEALERAETFRRQIQTHAKFRVTASFGVTEAHPDDRPEWLIKRADEALYRAKQHGRNCVEAEAGLLNELHLVE